MRVLRVYESCAGVLLLAAAAHIIQCYKKDLFSAAEFVDRGVAWFFAEHSQQSNTYTRTHAPRIHTKSLCAYT